jgi:hypothetical protein
MKASSLQKNAFQPGEKVFVAQGVYQGTIGTFLGLREDPNWSDIQELNGSVRTHPVVWLRHCPDGELVWSDLLRSGVST